MASQERMRHPGGLHHQGAAVRLGQGPAGCSLAQHVAPDVALVLLRTVRSAQVFWGHKQNPWLGHAWCVVGLCLGVWLVYVWLCALCGGFMLDLAA